MIGVTQSAFLVKNSASSPSSAGQMGVQTRRQQQQAANLVEDAEGEIQHGDSQSEVDDISDIDPSLNDAEIEYANIDRDTEIHHEYDFQSEVDMEHASIEQDAQHIFCQIEKELASPEDTAPASKGPPPEFLLQTKQPARNIITNNARRRRKRRRKPPPPYAPRCTGCALGNALASVWCCECARNLCTNCDDRLHGSGNTSLDPLLRPMCSHRVELIVDGGGVAILTPLLEISVLAAGLASLRPLLSAAGRALNVDYFFNAVCPVVSHVRRIVFRVDHALYPVLKGPLSAWCDTEDAFLKIFVDVWVRGVLTRTDSFALLLMKTPAAVGAFVVILTLAPLLAIPYALVATMLRVVEVVFVPNWAIFRFLAFLARCANDLVWLPFWIAAWFTRSTILGLVMDHDMAETFHRRRPIPPKTGKRLRPSPSCGLADISAGCVTRITRMFIYFRRRARKAIINAILTSVFLAFALRIFLLYSPRCGGTGIFATQAQVAWNVVDAIEGGEHEAPPQCVSVHHLSRKLAKRFGVDVPELEGLGKDAEILRSLQEATGNDYIDETLRNASRGIFYYISRADFRVKAELCIILALIFFAGVLRRIVYWADLHRRYRWIGKIASAIDDLGLDDENDESSVESDTSTAEEDDTAVEVESTQAGALDNQKANVQM